MKKKPNTEHSALLVKKDKKLKSRSRQSNNKMCTFSVKPATENHGMQFL